MVKINRIAFSDLTSAIVLPDNLLPIFMVKYEDNLCIHEDEPERNKNYNIGWGKGYVGIPKWHPLFNVSHREIEAHRGIHVQNILSYSNLSDDETHWILGFHTIRMMGIHVGMDYDYAFVRNQCIHLRNQLMDFDEVRNYLRIHKIKKLQENLL